MLKLFSFFIIFTISLCASDKVEIYATTMDSKDNIVEASGGVNVIYREYFLSADSAIYDRETGDLELFDNIRVNHGSDYKILGSYAKLNIAKKERLFKPFYMLDKKTKNYYIKITSGTVWGCNPIDPLWEMEFS
jgi:LPS-assembly protein